MLITGTVLQNRYQIVRQLGQGGMGAVFEAIDQRLDTTVALKETLFADERLRKQFEREARLLARLHHPALPRVSDHFSEGDGQFLVMQFIGGEDLAEMITRRRGPFPVDQVLSWADQLLDALDYLHTQDPQIIHRDIKPQNLKLTTRGQVILLDFGLAKGQASEVSRVTTSASIFGYTPNYAPLEQVQGLGTDPRSDIYSLSATLFHLLTGEKPPDSLTRAAAIVNGQPDPLVPANQLNKAVSEETAEVIARGMAQNREQRYSTAAAMRRALQGSGEGGTVSNRSEANTVLFPTAAPIAAPATDVNIDRQTVHAVANTDTVPRGETTVVRSQQPAKSAKSPWLLAGAAGLMLTATAGGFYVYQHRNESNTLNSPAANSVSSPVATPESSPVTQASTSTPPVTPPPKTESNADEIAAAKKQKEKERTAAAREEKRAPKIVIKKNPDETDEIVLPELEVRNPSVQQRPGVRRYPGGVSIRTFPDGSQLITNPDGTRVLVKPDGTKQVFGNPRMNRRRNPPAPPSTP
jgi:serine/threonine protein kinase